jgi:hypothetical protein
VTFKLEDGSNKRGYAATTSKALADAQLRLSISLTASGQTNQVEGFGCQLSSSGTKPDAATLAVTTDCLQAVLPPADAQKAASWVARITPGLSGGIGAGKSGRGDLRTFDIDGYTVALQHVGLPSGFGFGVTVSRTS